MENKDNKKYWENRKLLGAQVEIELYNKIVDFAATNGMTVSNAVRFILINFLASKGDNENGR